MECGYNEVVGANSAKIISAVTTFDSKRFNKENELYGGGTAANFIVAFSKKYRDQI